MCILQPRSLLLAWGAVAGLALAPTLAMAQSGFYSADSGAPSQGKNLSRVLTAAGVPNTSGHLQWPLGLRLVGGTEADQLRRQIAALLQYGAEQTQTGPVSPHLREELARSVDALRKLLRRDREERFSLALTSYEECERFLAQLDHVRKLFEPEPEPSKGKDP